MKSETLQMPTTAKAKTGLNLLLEALKKTQSSPDGTELPFARILGKKLSQAKAAVVATPSQINHETKQAGGTEKGAVADADVATPPSEKRTAPQGTSAGDGPLPARVIQSAAKRDASPVTAVKTTPVEEGLPEPGAAIPGIPNVPFASPMPVSSLAGASRRNGSLDRDVSAEEKGNAILTPEEDPSASFLPWTAIPSARLSRDQAAAGLSTPSVPGGNSAVNPAIRSGKSAPQTTGTTDTVLEYAADHRPIAGAGHRTMTPSLLSQASEQATPREAAYDSLSRLSFGKENKSVETAPKAADKDTPRKAGDDSLARLSSGLEKRSQAAPQTTEEASLRTGMMDKPIGASQLSSTDTIPRQIGDTTGETAADRNRQFDDGPETKLSPVARILSDMASRRTMLASQSSDSSFRTPILTLARQSEETPLEIGMARSRRFSFASDLRSTRTAMEMGLDSVNRLSETVSGAAGTTFHSNESSLLRDRRIRLQAAEGKTGDRSAHETSDTAGITTRSEETGMELPPAARKLQNDGATLRTEEKPSRTALANPSFAAEAHPVSSLQETGDSAMPAHEYAALNGPSVAASLGSRITAPSDTTQEMRRLATGTADRQAHIAERDALSPRFDLGQVFLSRDNRPATEAVPASLNMQTMIDEIQRLQQSTSAEVSRVHIELDPPNLGTVGLEVVCRREHLEIVMTTDNAGVQQALQSRSDDIRLAMQRQDLKVETFQILLQDNGAGQQQTHGGWAQEQRRDSQARMFPHQEEVGVEAISSLLPSAEPASGIVSTFA